MKFRALDTNKKSTIYWCAVETFLLYGQLKSRPYDVFENAVMTDGTEKCLYLQLHRAKLAKYAELDIPLGDLHASHIDISWPLSIFLMWDTRDLVTYKCYGVDKKIHPTKPTKMRRLTFCPMISMNPGHYMLTRRNRCRILSNSRQIFTSSHVAEGKILSRIGDKASFQNQCQCRKNQN